jgi:hypothetical protein
MHSKRLRTTSRRWSWAPAADVDTRGAASPCGRYCGRRSRILWLSRARRVPAGVRLPMVPSCTAFIAALPQAHRDTRQDWEEGEICIAASVHLDRTRALSPRSGPGSSNSVCSGGTRASCSFAAAPRPGGVMGKQNWDSVICSTKHHVISAQQYPPGRRHQANRHSTPPPSRSKTTRSRLWTGAPTGMPKASATSGDAPLIETRSWAFPSGIP